MLRAIVYNVTSKRSVAIDGQRHREILRRLNSFDTGPTEDDRRAGRQAAIERAVEAESELKWGRISAGIAGGMFGGWAEPRR